MHKTKERKVTFNSLIERKWRTQHEMPFNQIEDTVNYVLKLKKIDRQYDMKDNKFCLLQHAKTELDKDGDTVITGYFKSARQAFRPNLIDRITGDERKSPKKLSEGDIEKTHFLIKVTDDEVFLILEINGNGVSISQITNYFNHFVKFYLNSIKKKKGFSLIYAKIGRDDFLSEIKAMKRVRIAEVFFDKKLLGSNCLDFSNRTGSVQRNIVLTATAEKLDSIQETAIDFFNSFSNSKKNSISKVRVSGKDEHGTNVVLDTSFMEKTDHLVVSLNPETGEVITTEILSGLKAFAKQFK